MIRILVFFLAILALALLFAGLAERPGEVALTIGGYEYRLTLMVAAIVGTALVATVMFAWWVIKAIWHSPRTVGRYFRARKRDRGYQALSTGLIAAGAGDGGLARKMNKQASTQLNADQEPLLHLLDAQALMLEGRHDAAREKFEAMTEDPETRLLGLRGLYLEARRLGDHEAARHYAEQAADAAPSLAWAVQAAMSARLIEEDYDGALKLADGQAATRQVPRDEADRRRAVLLVGKAMAVLDQDPSAARTAALEASRLAPDLVPASVVAGRALFRNDEIRKGMRILEAAWKRGPHPEIAEAYVHARAGDSTHDRLKRAKRLESIRPDHVESSLVVARAALEAGEFKAARLAAEAAVDREPRESAFLLLADIEEAETSDQGRVRQWLSKALRAPRDPAWMADGQVAEKWAPVSPVTGAIGAFEWRAPAGRTGAVIDAVDDPSASRISRMPDEGPLAAGDKTPPPEPEKKSAMEPVEPAQTSVEPAEEAIPGEADVALPPIPDDPGVEVNDQRDEGAARFRLF